MYHHRASKARSGVLECTMLPCGLLDLVIYRAPPKEKIGCVVSTRRKKSGPWRIANFEFLYASLNSASCKVSASGAVHYPRTVLQKKFRKCTNCWMSHHNRANGFAMYQWYSFPSIIGKSNF